MIGTLHLFRNLTDLDNFGTAVVETYRAMTKESAKRGRALDDSARAVLLSRLALRMLKYKAEAARAFASDDCARELDAEEAVIWPTLRRYLDEEIAEARLVIETMREARKAATQ